MILPAQTLKISGLVLSSTLALALTACGTTPAALSTSNNAIPPKDPDCQLNAGIQRKAIPATPNRMSLPAFGQGIIGWGTGPEGARQRLASVQVADLPQFKAKGVTLDMVREWQAFYDNEVIRNPCNPTAPYRAALMKKIADFWSE